MSRNIKCPECGTWNKWGESNHLICEDCGYKMKDPHQERKEKREAFDREQLDKWMFTIKEEDSKPVILLKKAGNVAYMVFMAIVAFVSWLIAMIPG